MSKTNQYGVPVRKPFMPPPPGYWIRRELAARGWTQHQFAQILGRPLQTINQIINGKKRITPETAVAIGSAFGTSAEGWLNLEISFRLSRLKGPDPRIARRAQKLKKRSA